MREKIGSVLSEASLTQTMSRARLAFDTVTSTEDRAYLNQFAHELSHMMHPI